MNLTRIDPEKPGHDQRTFHCFQCGKETTEVVEFK